MGDDRQLDLFDWRPEPRQLAIVHRGVVMTFTNYIDGRPAWWPERWDYAALSDGTIAKINTEKAGPFFDPSEAMKPYGPDTAWPSFKRLEAKAKQLAEL